MIKAFKYIFGIIFVLIVVSKIFGNRERESSFDKTPAQAIEVKTPEVVAETCIEIENLFGENSKKTELQKEELWTSKFHDREFDWKLAVVEIDKAIDGEPYVEFACRANGKSSKVLVYYEKEDLNDLLALKKGNQYRIRGILRGYSGIFGYLLTSVPVPRFKPEKVSPNTNANQPKGIKWWAANVDASGASCIPASSSLDPENILKANPDCFKDQKPSDPKGLLILNCLKVPSLRTQFAYYDSQERCLLTLSNLEQSGALDSEIQMHKNRQGSELL